MPSKRSIPLRQTHCLCEQRRARGRAALTAGIGVCLSWASFTAEAGDILRGGTSIGARPGAGARDGQSPAATAQAAANAREVLGRTTQALKAVQAMQAAARITAIKGPGNLGVDPNHPGSALPNVPNGLRPGGLQVAPGVPTNLTTPGPGEDPALWRGALLPKESTSKGHTTVTIKQTAPQALLTWETFNVGKETTVNFNQKAGTQDDGSNNWIVFNKILDPSGVPSQILGSITAEGAVYLINQNGIIFGGSSQINLHSFVASSLPINDGLITRGLLNNPEGQFLFSQLPLEGGSGSNAIPAFTPAAPLTPDGRNGDVIVEPGALISARTNAAHVGGRVALIGANVRNDGTISTPDGQTILAAGLQVGMTAHPTSDPSLRGLDVYVGAIATPPGARAEGEPATQAEKPYAGTATNSGLIDVPRASAVITGKNVNQLGAINSTTSVSLNGRIDLFADYDAVGNLENNISNVNSTGVRNLSPYAFLPRSSGTVTLGPSSMMQILPELGSSETVIGTQLALSSQINIQGHAIHLGEDSTILAPNASVAINAGVWKVIPGVIPSINFINAGGQIYLEPDAMINVAGSSGISAAMSQNILSVELRGSELADAPLQRNGPFRGVTLQVDVRQTGIYNGRTWIGTPLANVSGYVGLIERTVGELTTAGGTVKLNAGSSVVMQQGSTIDVSGGWINYEGGMVQTSRIVSGSRVLDISQVSPDLIHEGFYDGKFTLTHPKYGLSETFTNPLALTGAHFEEAYTFGANGGTVSITAPAMALDGELIGRTVAGPRQRTVAPVPGTLSLAFLAHDPAIAPGYPIYSPTPPAITFATDGVLPAADAFTLDTAGDPLALRADRLAMLVLSPKLLTDSGFGILRIDNHDGDIIVPAGISLKTAPGGTIAMKGANIDIQGDVAAPSGALSFETFNVSLAKLNALATNPQATTPAPEPTRGVFTLGATASLSTAGLIVDDRSGAPNQAERPLFIKGGTIVINGYSADLRSGSVIDASGGVAMSPTNARTFGAGGAISIGAGQDLSIKSVLGGQLELGATLQAFSGSRGGSLTILAPLVQIGGTTANSDVLLLAPEFFNEGGFGSFTLNGLGARKEDGAFIPAVSITSNTIIAPRAKNYVAMIDPEAPNGVALTPILMPEGLRTPVSLSFGALGVTDPFVSTIQSLLSRGDFVMGEGAAIRTDPLGNVAISGNTATVRGTVIAPGGTISISGKNNAAILEQNGVALVANVYLGPHTSLSTAATTIRLPDPRGYHTGMVLPGGSISVSGNIVAEAGAMLDVSGADGMLDLRPTYSIVDPLTGSSFEPSLHSFRGYPLVRTLVESNAGSIVLTGDQVLLSDATLIGKSGGASALGGSLTISSGRFTPPGGQPLTPLDVTLTVTQSADALPQTFRVAGSTAVGKPILDRDGNAIAGRGYFFADTFHAGGFDALALRGTVEFSGAVALRAAGSLNVADGGVIFTNSAVGLTAPYVALGTAFHAPFSPLDVQIPFTFGSRPFNFDPTHGGGSLTVRAELIDVGNLSLQNTGRLNLIADGGDIRGDGTLDVAGNIILRAGQIYVPTEVSFTIAASDYQADTTPKLGAVRIVGSGARPLPLSAGGELNVFASTIEQGGVLRAPLGSITIGWDGTGVAPKDPITGKAFATAQTLTLRRGSITSVSAIDRATGQPLLIPYGINFNESSWIDPSGTDITAGGVPQKSIVLSGINLLDRKGSIIEMQGGGDLYAYRWSAGIGGTTDVLAASSSFAVIPGQQFDYAPYATFNTGANAASLAGDPGYVNGSLKIGDRIYLGESNGLAAGTYTLLPARYALMPGAFLVTPTSGIPVGSQGMPDGSSIVSGYRFNELNTGQSGQPLTARFAIASADIVRERAEYHDFAANSFLRERSTALGLKVPRLPLDAGHLALSALQQVSLKGNVLASAPSGALGGLVDISSSSDIVVAGPGAVSSGDALVLNSSDLSAFGADSLLIGGVREIGVGGTRITVKTTNLTVDNARAALTGPEIILVANKALTLAQGAVIEQSGRLIGGGDTLLLGDRAAAGSGDGTLLRATSDRSAQVIRTGLSSSTEPKMIIGAGARIAGASITLDSSYATTLDSNAVLDGSSIALNSGQITLALDNAGALQPGAGLVLSGAALQSLQSARSLSLLSYSSIDVYGTGAITTDGRLAFHAAEIRGFNNDGGAAIFSAPTIIIDNGPEGVAPGAITAPAGTLAFDAGTIELGAHLLNVDQFARVELKASGGVLVRDAGSLRTQGALAVAAPLITGAKAANYTIGAGGALTIEGSTGSPADSVRGGLGATLTFQGTSIAANSDILLPSGSLTLHATGGDLLVGGQLDVGGTTQTFHDLTKYTRGGGIRLISDSGAITVASGGVLAVAAPDGVNAGSISISAPTGGFALMGGMRGAGGSGGSFSLDVASVPNGSVGTLNSVLNAGGFTQSRSIRLRTGDVLVDGLATARTSDLSADQGSIVVTGTIDASGATGGVINLQAGGSITLRPGALLTAAADDFSHAGKGGAIALEAGSQTNGTFSSSASVDIQSGSTIDLSVASAVASSNTFGNFSGTLHLRAPQNATSTDLQISAINGAVLGASSITVEGYKIFMPSGGNISSAVQTDVRNNATLFGGNSAAITARLLTNISALEPVASIVPGAELINLSGNLTLGTATSTSSSDWDLSTFRFGPKNAPGVLTLRAAGNIVFLNALSDGFASSSYDAALLAQNPLLPLNSQSWSYRLSAGADFSAADFHRVAPLATLGLDAGSLLLGKNYESVFSSGSKALTRTAVLTRYQVIRTGSGDIEIFAGRDVKLLNQFATIFTAGTQVADPTILPGGTFDVPILDASGGQTALGDVQQNPGYPAQYSLAGGNVSIFAGGDIAHQTKNGSGALIADSSKQVPINWLYRRGYVDPTTGQFGRARFGDMASTTWWIDFSSFFEGVGALGGGNVTMIAGNDIANVDGLVPTNARMPKGAPNARNLLELGGGDLVIRANRDIDGGVYYVERGFGALTAGNSIHTNSTRSPSRGAIISPAEIFAPQTWLPTTLFAGKASFDVSANSDLLLGPVANPFLLPGGYNNTYWYKSYFSTYAPDSAVNLTSLGGSVTIRAAATVPSGEAVPMLQAWLENVSLLSVGIPQSVSFYQPWLRLDENSVKPFGTAVALMPSTLRATAFSGDINLVGRVTLFPSPRGTIELTASGSLNGLQPNGLFDIGDATAISWGTSRINLSDADPNRVPGIASPLAYQQFVGTTAAARTTGATFLTTLDALFKETGSTIGAAVVLQTKQALHASGPLHAGDPEPARLYAGNDISGITLFSGKAGRVIAGNDVTDVALYLQNVDENDVSVVAAGRDIVAFNANSPLRVAAQARGNVLNFGEAPLAGDLQISGPGTLEVLAGRNLDLGTGPNKPDGTGVGITSIGNARNLSLPFEGASIVAGAGIGASSGLENSSLDFDAFIDQLPAETLAQHLAEITGNAQTDLGTLPVEQRNLLALEVFYRVLRDAGRDQATVGNYDTGFAAIDALFPHATPGDIITQAREIRTKNGGDISIFAPGGRLALAATLTGNELAPPGIVTEAGGNVSIFTDKNVDIGISRIFTLRGGNIIIWSSEGDIAAGSSAKTVQSAPPTRVLVDPQTADVNTDLAGLATGGGIGVLATVEGVPPGDVDLIAPGGVIDAGDAGIRSAGNLSIAATQVLNAGNIQVGGSSGGVPSSPTVAAPNLGGLSAASNTAGAANSAASAVTKQQQPQAQPKEELPSIITVEVLGYGGGTAPAGSGSDEDEEQRKKKKLEESSPEAPSTEAPPARSA